MIGWWWLAPSLVSSGQRIFGRLTREKCPLILKAHIARKSLQSAKMRWKGDNNEKKSKQIEELYNFHIQRRDSHSSCSHFLRFLVELFFSIVNAYEIEHRGTALFNFTHTDLSHLWSALECVAIWCSLPRPTIGFVLLFFFFIKICFKKAVVNYTCTPGSNTQFLCRDLFHGYNKSSTDGDTWVANAVCQDAVHHSRVWVNYSRGHKTRNKETQNISNK